MSAARNDYQTVIATLGELHAVLDRLRGEFVQGIKTPADYARATDLLDELTDGRELSKTEGRILVELEDEIGRLFSGRGRCRRIQRGDFEGPQKDSQRAGQGVGQSSADQGAGSLVEPRVVRMIRTAMITPTSTAARPDTSRSVGSRP